MGSFYVRQRFRTDTEFEELEDAWQEEIRKPDTSFRADLADILDGVVLPVGGGRRPDPAPPWRDVGVEVVTDVGVGGSKSEASLLLATAARQLLSGRYREHWQIFTDGSVGHLGAGAGVYVKASGASYAYSFRKCSSTVAELVAIVVALRQLEELPDLPRQVVVVSDSKPALQSVVGTRGPGSPICEEIDLIVRAFGERGCEITFQWVPSHSGVRGNELADRAAAAGSSRDDRWPGPISHVDLPPLLQEAKNHVKIMTQFLWARDFERESRGERWLPNALPVPPNRVQFRGFPLLVASLMSRISWNRGRRPFGTQRFVCVCGQAVTFPHCLFQCPGLAAAFVPLHERMRGMGLPLGVEALSRVGMLEQDLLRLAAELILGSPVAGML
jgi:ribonuclease HI